MQLDLSKNTPHLTLDRHREGCTDPFNVKRLYIRDYDDNGKQCFISYGLTCLGCNMVIKEVFQQKPTLKQKQEKIARDSDPFFQELARMRGIDLFHQVH